MKLLNTFLLVAVLLSWFSGLDAKVLIITHAYKRDDFIELQYKTFKEFLKDDYEFVVFNDAKDSVTSKKIESVCQRLNIKYIAIPQEIHRRPYLPREPGEAPDNPSVANSVVVQYSLDTIGFSHDDIVMIVDSDMFLVKPFSVADYMNGYDISGLSQTRKHILYLWVGLVFLDMRTLPDKRELSFNLGEVDGQRCDTGGYTYYYLKNHPNLRLKFVDGLVYVSDFMNTDKEKLDPFMRLMVEENISGSEFFMDHTFFHYRGGSNWENKSNSYHRKKTNALYKLIDLAIKQNDYNSEVENLERLLPAF